MELLLSDWALSKKEAREQHKLIDLKLQNKEWLEANKTVWVAEKKVLSDKLA